MQSIYKRKLIQNKREDTFEGQKTAEKMVQIRDKKLVLIEVRCYVLVNIAKVNRRSLDIYNTIDKVVNKRYYIYQIATRFETNSKHVVN